MSLSREDRDIELSEMEVESELSLLVASRDRESRLPLSRKEVTSCLFMSEYGLYKLWRLREGLN